MSVPEHESRFAKADRYAGEFFFGAFGTLFLAGIPLGIWTGIELLMGRELGLLKFVLAVPVCIAVGAAFAFQSYRDERAGKRNGDIPDKMTRQQE